MSEFTEEIPGQIAAGIKRLGDGEYTFYSIYPLPPDAAYDETVYPDEWIQTTGTAPDRLTVEIRRLDPDGSYRVYTVGHSEAADETAETEPIHNGDNTYHVRPAEVLTAAEAIDLFRHYYEHHALPAGWHLRQQAEFTTPADGPAPAGKSAAGTADTASGSPAAARTQDAAHKDVSAGKPQQQRGTN
ncbi:hypothetical protein A5791_18510 [Mycobacterium sp. 852002-51163_SCH5372311]|uniref:hypothetical protein n=1 Tax=Mycobacterium sp. 852002-51163_SCH5372311 TaxID=1834097 RepID=UPI000800A993|nr:hypothetical protein [Mycobacterium sp. 852002-51163_SCH5372311]OBF87922.1 hypothetical protein A5791_18510 [Mycobacterium sp. 852002-51163_SCH5372311]